MKAIKCVAGGAFVFSSMCSVNKLGDSCDIMHIESNDDFYIEYVLHYSFGTNQNCKLP